MPAGGPGGDHPRPDEAHPRAGDGGRRAGRLPARSGLRLSSLIEISVKTKRKLKKWIKILNLKINLKKIFLIYIKI